VLRLNRTQFPASKSELARAMTEGVRPYFSKGEPAVIVHARVFPYLDEIAVNFDDAQLDGTLPPLPKVMGETKSECEAANVTLSGRNMTVLGAPVNLQVQARDVVFHSGRDESGKMLLLLKSVRTGRQLSWTWKMWCGKSRKRKDKSRESQ
jgi:hypothetical protein